MKKYILSFFIIIAFAGYILYQRGTEIISVFNGEEDGPVVMPSSLVSPSPTPLPTTASGSPAPSNSPPPTPTPQLGQYRNGTYTGSVADAYYGYIQVRATISGGKLTDVVFLQYPNDRQNSIRINTIAMPYLKAEAIQAQSANVDIVSGATDTSQAFIQSLASALSQAKI